MWPPDDELLSLWQRVLSDFDHGSEFAAVVIEPLIDSLRRSCPHAQCDDIIMAANDAVMGLLRHAETFDPARGKLSTYLRMSARGDLRNLLKKESRHQRGRIPWEHVELTLPARNEDEPAETFADVPAVLAAIAALDGVERSAFELMRDGERDTAAFADALGLTELPDAEQATEVKRVKDRVKARLKRAGGMP